jgi:rubrerythrin
MKLAIAAAIHVEESTSSLYGQVLDNTGRRSMPITPNQAIRNAIEAERAASRFYRFLSENTEDPESRRFLSELAESELGHAAAIEKEGCRIVDGPLASRADSPVELVESLPEWKNAENITLAEAIEVAHAAELQACMYYDAFADQIGGVTGEFFRGLAKTEEEHARRLDERRKSLRDV